MDPKIAVRIDKASKPTAWYSDKIGECFVVIDRGGETYILADDYQDHPEWFRNILKEDATPIPE